MKQVNPPHRRALAALVPTVLVLAAPAFAQVATQTTPPPQASVSAPAPQAAPAQQAPVIQMAPQAPVVQQQMHQEGVTPSANDASTPTATRASRTAPARTAPVRQAAPRAVPPAAAPVKAAPAKPAVATAPAESTPAATPPAAPQAAPQAAPETGTQAAPVATSDQTQQTQTTTAATDNSLVTFLVGGLIGLIVILGVAALMVRRRRRAEDEAVYQEPAYQPQEVAAEPAYVEPAPAPVAAAPEPVAAAPVAAPRHEPEIAHQIETVGDAAVAAPEQAEIVAPEAADVEALTAADAPVSNRPWLEMAMRPVRAGTSTEDAVVEIELTIGNSGSVAADDVRIATFMFAGEPDSGEMERLLVERDAAAVPPVRIDAGEGKTLEATLAIPREAIDGEISPVIVADARYTLPDGGEGRTSATFRVGVAQEDGSISPLHIGRPHMTQTVNAELYGEVEHA